MAKKKNFMFCKCKHGDKKPIADNIISKGQSRFLYDGMECKCDIVASRRKMGLPTAKIKKLSGIGDITLSIGKLF